MLIDRFLPHGDFAERHEIAVAASPERTWAAVRALDLRDDAVIRTVLRIRGIPVAGKLTLDEAPRLGFMLLGEEPGVEVVVGVVGRFWRPTGNIHRIDPERFTRFDDAGFAKAAWNFRVISKAPGRCLVVTHTRIVCTDAVAKRKMGRYWMLIRPFSGWIRLRALSLIKRAAERDSMNAT